jgi:hypothetical protein
VGPRNSDCGNAQHYVRIRTYDFMTSRIIMVFEAIVGKAGCFAYDSGVHLNHELAPRVISFQLLGLTSAVS